MHSVASSVVGIGLTAVGLLPPVEVAVQVFRGGEVLEVCLGLRGFLVVLALVGWENS